MTLLKQFVTAEVFSDTSTDETEDKLTHDI